LLFFGARRPRLLIHLVLDGTEFLRLERVFLFAVLEFLLALVDIRHSFLRSLLLRLGQLPQFIQLFAFTFIFGFKFLYVLLPRIQLRGERAQFSAASFKLFFLLFGFFDAFEGLCLFVFEILLGLFQRLRLLGKFCGAFLEFVRHLVQHLFFVL